ncbi:MAG TPA: leucyl aminopeptidase family protein, partial [Rhabdaerophilum sp.]|nr:leucyl aminopeptidase family protein [Rhabdaerophilum sp.]
MCYLACLNGAYRFSKYKESETPVVTFEPPAGCEAGRVERVSEALATGRDLINTPANEMTTEALAGAARALAAR